MARLLQLALLLLLSLQLTVVVGAAEKGRDNANECATKSDSDAIIDELESWRQSNGSKTTVKDDGDFWTHKYYHEIRQWATASAKSERRDVEYDDVSLAASIVLRLLGWNHASPSCDAEGEGGQWHDDEQLISHLLGNTTDKASTAAISSEKFAEVMVKALYPEGLPEDLSKGQQAVLNLLYAEMQNDPQFLRLVRLFFVTTPLFYIIVDAVKKHDVTLLVRNVMRLMHGVPSALSVLSKVPAMNPLQWFSTFNIVKKTIANNVPAFIKKSFQALGWGKQRGCSAGAADCSNDEEAAEHMWLMSIGSQMLKSVECVDEVSIGDRSSHHSLNEDGTHPDAQQVSVEDVLKLLLH